MPGTESGDQSVFEWAPKNCKQCESDELSESQAITALIERYRTRLKECVATQTPLIGTWKDLKIREAEAKQFLDAQIVGIIRKRSDWWARVKAAS